MVNRVSSKNESDETGTWVNLRIFDKAMTCNIKDFESYHICTHCGCIAFFYRYSVDYIEKCNPEIKASDFCFLNGTQPIPFSEVRCGVCDSWQPLDKNMLFPNHNI